jgi:hypothetical protein
MRRTLVISSVIISSLLVLTALVASSQPATAAGPVEVGAAIGGVNAVEFVGRVEENGLNFVSYGYLTHISGLTDTLLFSSTLTDANNAHFTFYSTATLTSRFIISSVFTIDAVGQTVYYFHPASGADSSNPASFASGVPIVTATIRSQTINNVQAPNVGVDTNFAEFTQTGVSPFTLNGIAYQLGRVGILKRLFYTGENKRTDPITPKSFTVMVGNAVVTGVPGQVGFIPLILRNAP